MNVNNAYCSPNNYFYQPTFPQLYSASMMPRYGFFPSLSGGFSGRTKNCFLERVENRSEVRGGS